MTTSDRKPAPAEASLQRSLSLPLLVFYGVGTILGLGIYVLLGEVASTAGRLTPAAFLGAALLAVFTALSYGELSARIPLSAGEVNYVDEAFDRPWLSGAVGWLIVLSTIVSTATVVNGYVEVFVELPDWTVIATITGVLVAGSAIVHLDVALPLMAALVLLSSLMWVLVRGGRALSRIDGGVLIASWIVFVVYVAWDASVM